MLPDPQNGSYRETRFDWSGIISSLQFNGHEYFGQWYPRHDPKIHDAITGPVEEFRTEPIVLVWITTRPSRRRICPDRSRIVRKPEEKAYRPYDTYDIVDPGTRTVRPHKDRVEFEHRLSVSPAMAMATFTARRFRS